MSLDLKKYTQLLNLWNIIIAVYYLKEIAKKNEFLMNRNGGVTVFESRFLLWDKKCLKELTCKQCN